MRLAVSGCGNIAAGDERDDDFTRISDFRLGAGVELNGYGARVPDSNRWPGRAPVSGAYWAQASH